MAIYVVVLPSSSSDFLNVFDNSNAVGGSDSRDIDGTTRFVVGDTVVGAWDSIDVGFDVVDDIVGAWDGDNTTTTDGIDEILGAWDSGDTTGVDGTGDDIVGGSVVGSDDACITGVLVVVGVVGKLEDEGKVDDGKAEGGREIEVGDVSGGAIVGDGDGGTSKPRRGGDPWGINLIIDGIDIVDGMTTETASKKKMVEDEYMIESWISFLYVWSWDCNSRLLRRWTYSIFVTMIVIV